MIDWIKWAEQLTDGRSPESSYDPHLGTSDFYGRWMLGVLLACVSQQANTPLAVFWSESVNRMSIREMQSLFELMVIFFWRNGWRICSNCASHWNTTAMIQDSMIWSWAEMAQMFGEGYPHSYDPKHPLQVTKSPHKTEVLITCVIWCNL